MQYLVSSYEYICNIRSNLESAKNFSIQSYGFREINVSDGQLIINDFMLHNLRLSFGQILLSSN